MGNPTRDEAMRTLQATAQTCDVVASLDLLLRTPDEEAFLLVENELQHCGLHHHSSSRSAPYGTPAWKQQLQELRKNKQTLLVAVAASALAAQRLAPRLPEGDEFVSLGTGPAP